MPEPLPPSLDDLPLELLRDLVKREAALPIERLRNWADYWALCSVEKDHIARSTRRYGLADADRTALGTWWEAVVASACGERMAKWRAESRASHHRYVRAPQSRLRNALFQLRLNTVGPGAWCWFGNRHTTIRRYMFRLRWRP